MLKKWGLSNILNIRPISVLLSKICNALIFLSKILINMRTFLKSEVRDSLRFSLRKLTMMNFKKDNFLQQSATREKEPNKQH